MKYDKGFAYVWEYRVPEDSLEQFLEAYGPEGEWVRLFRQGDGHVRTELLADANDPFRFVTVDYWRSRKDRDSFRKAFAIEFAELDERCESLTTEEKFIGDFGIFG